MAGGRGLNEPLETAKGFAVADGHVCSFENQSSLKQAVHFTPIMGCYPSSTKRNSGGPKWTSSITSTTHMLSTISYAAGTLVVDFHQIAANLF